MSSRYYAVGSSQSFIQALSTDFDGINEYCQVTGVSLNGSAQCTLSIWFKTSTAQANKYLLSLPRTTGGNGFDINFKNGGNIRTILVTSGGSALPEFAATYSDGDWHNVVSSYNGVNVALYFDGLFKTSTAVTGTITTTLNEIDVGRLASGGAYSKALYDEVSIWDIGLDASEVTELYNSGTPTNLVNHSAAANLVNWYRMGDGDTFPTITDNKGSDNLTMFNMTAGNFVLDTP